MVQGGHASSLLNLQTRHLHLLCTSTSTPTTFLLLLLTMGIAYSVGEVDHLYTFFVQWSPDIYNKYTKKPSYLVVKNDKLTAFENLLHASAPTDKHLKIVSVSEGRHRQSLCSLEDQEPDEHQDPGDLQEPENHLPVLINHSQLLDEHHIQSLANHMPVRTQVNPWRLIYSTAIHGTSLKTLYRTMAELDSPVLLVIKDMENKVFGAFSSEPFRVSNYCYGTGETFLYSFRSEFKAYRWSGENSYFVRGHLDSLQIGAGGGHFGLWLDSALDQGSSFACHTFRNQPLSTKQDFKVQDVEVWTVQ